MISSNQSETLPYIEDIFSPPWDLSKVKPFTLIIADKIYKEILNKLGHKPYWVIAEHPYFPRCTGATDGMTQACCWDLLEKELHPIPKTARNKTCYRFAFKILHKGEIVYGVQPIVLWNFHFDGSADYKQRSLNEITLDQRNPYSEIPMPKHVVDWTDYIDECSDVIRV